MAPRPGHPQTDRTRGTREESEVIATDVSPQAVIPIDPKFLEALKVGTTATELFTGLTKTLEGVTDVATAEAALPELEKFAPLLATLLTEAGNLPADEKPALAAFVGKNLSRFGKLFDKVMSIPGVKSVLDPAMTPIVEGLEEVAR